MNTFSDFETTVDITVSKQRPTATRKIDNQVLVDEDMKRKWDKAKDRKERTAALIVVNEMALHILNQVSNCATGDLVQLVKQYADLSLVGSCSAWAESVIKYLEFTLNTTMSWDIGQREIVEESLGHMKRKLELLNKFEEDTQRGVSG